MIACFIVKYKYNKLLRKKENIDKINEHIFRINRKISEYKQQIERLKLESTIENFRDEDDLFIDIETKLDKTLKMIKLNLANLNQYEDVLANMVSYQKRLLEKQAHWTNFFKATKFRLYTTLLFIPKENGKAIEGENITENNKLGIIKEKYNEEDKSNADIKEEIEGKENDCSQRSMLSSLSKFPLTSTPRNESKAYSFKKKDTLDYLLNARNFDSIQEKELLGIIKNCFIENAATVFVWRLNQEVSFMKSNPLSRGQANILISKYPNPKKVILDFLRKSGDIRFEHEFYEWFDEDSKINLTRNSELTMIYLNVIRRINIMEQKLFS